MLTILQFFWLLYLLIPTLFCERHNCTSREDNTRRLCFPFHLIVLLLVSHGLKFFHDLLNRHLGNLVFLFYMVMDHVRQFCNLLVSLPRKLSWSCTLDGKGQWRLFKEFGMPSLRYVVSSPPTSACLSVGPKQISNFSSWKISKCRKCSIWV